METDIMEQTLEELSREEANINRRESAGERHIVGMYVEDGVSKGRCYTFQEAREILKRKRELYEKQEAQEKA